MAAPMTAPARLDAKYTARTMSANAALDRLQLGLGLGGGGVAEPNGVRGRDGEGVAVALPGDESASIGCASSTGWWRLWRT